jgi:hypothetical protein
MAANLWERQEGESTKAFHAFTIYRDLGISRTIPEAHRRYTGRNQGGIRAEPPGYFEDWYKRFHWKDRAEAYDAYLEEAYRLESEAVWKERRNALREELWRDHDDLKTRVAEMLAFPISDIKVVKGENGLETHIHPGKWNFSTVCQMLELAARLGQQAVGVEPQTLAGGAEMGIQDWYILRGALLQALSKHPEALDDVSRALENFESS